MSREEAPFWPATHVPAHTPCITQDLARYAPWTPGHPVPLQMSTLELSLLIQIKKKKRKIKVDIEKESKNLHQKNLARKPITKNINKERW